MPKTGRASSATGCDLVSNDPGDLSKRGWELASGGDAVRGLACHEAATSLAGSGGLNWFHRARTEQQLGMDAQAIPSFQKAVEHRTLSLRANEAVEAYFQLAKLLREANGDIAGAERAYREVLRLGPDRSGGHIMLGVTLREANRLPESLHHYSYGLKLHPAIPAAQFNRGQIYSALQREGEAITSYRTALRVEPTFAIAHEQLGESLLSEARVGEATHSLQRATRMLPGAAVLYYSLGKLHFNRRQLNASIAAHHAALALAPEFAYVHNDVGNALSDMTGRQSEVLHHYSEAARLMPSFAEAFSNVGTILKDRGSVGEAARYFARAIEIKPVLCEAYKNLGSCHTETGKLVAARDAFEGALRINPQFWPALYALLDSKQFLCDWRGRPALLAVLQDHLDRLHGGGGLGAGPDERMHGGLSPFNTLVWPVSDRMRTLVTRHRARKDVEHAAASPLSPPLRWAGRAAAAAERARARAAVVEATTTTTTTGRPERLDGALAADALATGGGDGGMLRLGFISSDFGDHPVGHAVLPWLRALQRGGRVAVYAFASDSAERRHSGSELRRSLAASTRFFCDITDLSDEEAARTVNEQRVHVLINLVGHTAGARHSLTQRDVAPVQAMHYGYPGSTGLPAMHYMLLDAAAAPPSMRRQFVERFAYFPHSHFIAAHASRYPHVLGATARAHPWQGLGHGHQGHAATARGAVAVAGQAREPEPLRRLVRASDGTDASRADIGLMLRERDMRGVALCNFNQLYKLDPLTMEAWANALRRAPRAHLWLSRVTVRKDSSDIAEVNVGAHAAALGVRHDRLAYAWKYDDKDYIPFRALADLMVDNRLYNAHTTGADTFWAGVPAVALAANHLAGRATASFARALGVGSMVVPGLRGYEDATLDLATRAPRLWNLRRRLLHMRERAPFFDLPRLARAQEKLAHAMWEVFAAGVLPMHVAIAR